MFCRISNREPRRPSGFLTSMGRAWTAVLVVGLLGAGVSNAQDRNSENPRIAPLGSSETGINITRTLENHPALAEAWLTFARHILGGSTLPARDRELLILRIGFLCGSEYEWGQHTRIAKTVGVTDEEILRVIKGPDADGWAPFDSALLRAADELHSDSEVSDRTWNELATRYDTKQLMDTVFTVGQYNLVSMALRSFRVPLDEGVQGFPK